MINWWIAALLSAILVLEYLLRVEGDLGKWTRRLLRGASFCLIVVLSFKVGVELAMVLLGKGTWFFPVKIGLSLTVLIAFLIYIRSIVGPRRDPEPLKPLIDKVSRGMEEVLEEVKDEMSDFRESSDDFRSRVEARLYRLDEKVEGRADGDVEVSERSVGRIMEEVRREIRDSANASLSEEDKEDIGEVVFSKVKGLKEGERGLNFQSLSAQEFLTIGFDEVESYERGNMPDEILKNKIDGEMRPVAVTEDRDRKITGSTTLSYGNLKSAIDYAGERDLPVIIRWWNPPTRKLWYHVVEPGEVGEDFSLTVPRGLWKEEPSGGEERELIRKNKEAKARILELAEPKPTPELKAVREGER